MGWFFCKLLRNVPGDRLQREAAPAIDQRPGLGRGQILGAGYAGGLDEELLQHLDRERPVVLLKQLAGQLALGPFLQGDAPRNDARAATADLCPGALQ